MDQESRISSMLNTARQDIVKQIQEIINGKSIELLTQIEGVRSLVSEDKAQLKKGIEDCFTSLSANHKKIVNIIIDQILPPQAEIESDIGKLNIEMKISNMMQENAKKEMEYMNTKITNMENSITTLASRMSDMESSISILTSTMTNVESSITTLASKTSNMETKMTNMDRIMRMIAEKLDINTEM